MFFSADSMIFQNARELRKRPTDAERILWMHLRTRPQGYKFRRQHPAGNYIVDFYCHALTLAIEVDGSIHNEPAMMVADKERQSVLETSGISFIRFTNEQIKLTLDAVIRQIDAAIQSRIQNR